MSRSASGFRVVSFIVCDDVRREANGKEILIGVYSRDILVQSTPIVLPQLTFRIVLEIEKLFEQFKLVIIQPNKEKLLEFSGTGHPTNIEEWLHIPVKFGKAELPEVGTYIVRVTLNGVWRKAGQFNVRLPRNDDERRRLGIAGE